MIWWIDPTARVQDPAAGAAVGEIAWTAMTDNMGIGLR
jgi:hypothetical protein